MNRPRIRNRNGQFTSPETERRKLWAAMRLTPEERRMALPGVGCMTICEHLGRLQAINEGRAWK